MPGHGEMISPVRVVDVNGRAVTVRHNAVTGEYELVVAATIPALPPITGDVRVTDGLGNFVGLTFDPVANLWRFAVDAQLVVAANVALDGNIQVQNIERALATLAPGTFNGASRDCINYADFAVSVYAARGIADTTLDVVIEVSATGTGDWREVDRQVLTLDATHLTVNLNRNYTCTRRYMRISIVNNTDAADVEVVSNMKPIG